MKVTRSKRLGALVVAALATAHPAAAGGPQDVVNAEILPGWQTETGTYMAGLHLRLAPGWKTYWRAPGDAGIPPRFDWQGSRNVSGARVLWPTPQVFSSNGMRTIGYVDDVVLPIELTPREAGQPMKLEGRVELGVCHDICMPLELRLSGQLPAEGRAAPIRDALAAQPMTAREARVAGIRCTVEPISDGLRLTAEIDMPRLGGREEAVFELADPSVWVSEAETARDGARVIAKSDLVAQTGAPFALDRSTIRITVLGEDRAVDIRGCGAR